MDFFKFVGHGVALAGNPQQRIQAERDARELRQRKKVVGDARALWLNALLVDETRGWMEVLQESRAVLSGLCVVLGLAAFARSKDAGDSDAQVRVIRGAVSAIQQAGEAGSVITTDLLGAVASAARVGKEIFESCSDEAIEHAAHHMHALSRANWSQ